MRKLLLIVAIACCLCSPPANGQAVRLVTPKVAAPDKPSLVRVEQRRGNEWKLVDADAVTLKVSGGEVVGDPAAVPMNPLTVQPEAGVQRLTIDAQAAGASLSAQVPVREPEPIATVTVRVRPQRESHRFDGFGGGVLFYDNQWELSRGDEIWDWCFRDVKTTFLHLLARPDYEPENDNDDWRTLDASRMDFSASDRAIMVAQKALAKDPDLKVYLSLYSPPAWMKTNDSTAGEGGLKSGDAYRYELAEYVFAYLKRLKASGVAVEYLAFFNEPDWPHGQDGMHIPDMGELADVFDQTAAALEELVTADGGLTMPTLVFPDALGAGGITRSRRGTPQLLARRKMLSERVGVWGVHDYWNTGGYWPVRFKELRRFPPVGDKPIWMTEWAQRYRLGDLESANEYGANILNALRLGAQAWMVFEWCHPSQNQSGLISCDWEAKPPRQRYWRSKAYYVFQQLANATPAGAMVVKADARSTRGLLDPKANQSQVFEHLALVNTEDDGETLILHAYNRGGDPIELRTVWPGAAGEARVLITGPLADGQPYDGLSPLNGLGLAGCEGLLPPNSLVTIIAPIK